MRLGTVALAILGSLVVENRVGTWFWGRVRGDSLSIFCASAVLVAGRM